MRGQEMIAFRRLGHFARMPNFIVSALAAILALCGVTPARAQSYSSVLEHCRATVAYPIVHSCMVSKHGMGDRERNLAECRGNVRVMVSKCVENAMLHGRSSVAVSGHQDSGRQDSGHQDVQKTASKANLNAVPKSQTVDAPAAVTPAAVSSQQSAPATASLASPPATPFGRRVALIIGNGDYAHVPKLANATNDAKSLAAALTQSGFQSVTLKTDLKREEVVTALSEFARVADSADWAVVYYSGHGIEYRGSNYIIPVDARLLVDRDIDLEAVDIGKVMNVVDGAKRLRLIVLDACRNNPFLDQMKRTVATRGVTRGLAPVEPDAGSLIVYSAKHGETALDGDGLNSPFATALLKRLQVPNLEIRRLFDLVRDDVIASTHKQQQPFTYGSLSGSEDFYFTTK
jgi:hypothetical protein